MKNKFTKIVAVLIALITVFSLSACAASNPEDELLGTWEYRLENDGTLYASMTYTFYKSGDEYCGKMYSGSYDSSTSATFTYSVEGSNITYTLENGNTITDTFSISGNTLTLDNMKFTRK